MFKISRSLIDSIIIAAKSSYPNEFAALLGSTTENKLVDEFIAINSIKGATSVLIKQHLIPANLSIAGTVHSHPSSHAFPSDADKKLFSQTGSFNLIIGHPYDESTINAFNEKGEKISFKTVDL